MKENPKPQLMGEELASGQQNRVERNKSYRDLTIKQKMFCREYVANGGNGRLAAQKVYNIDNRFSAYGQSIRLLKNEKVQREIERLMDIRGITNDFLIKKLKEGIEAKRVIKTKNGKLKETNVSDLDTSYKWWESAAKIKNFFPASQTENKNFNIDLMIEEFSPEQLREALNYLLEEINAKSKE